MRDPSRREHQRRPNPSRAEALRQRFKESVDHVSQLSADERAAIITQISATAQADFASLTMALEQYVSQADQIPVLALLTSRYLAAPTPSAGTEIVEPPILSHHLDILQAFYLRQAPPETYISTPARVFSLEAIRSFAIAVQAVHEILPRLNAAFREKRLNSRSDDEKIDPLSELLRGNTQIMRGWGPPKQVLRIGIDILRPLDARAEVMLGYPVSPILSALTKVVGCIEDRINEHAAKLRRLSSAKSPSGLLAAASSLFPAAFPMNGDEFEIFPLLSMPIEIARDAVCCYLDVTVRPTHFKFTLDELVPLFGSSFTEADVRSVLSRISIAPGGLADHNIEFLFLDNPVWSKPLISGAAGEYILVIPTLIYTFPLEIMVSVIGHKPELVRLYSRSRASFLETEAARILSEAFPHPQMWRGSRWSSAPEHGKVFENDLLVSIGHTMLVIEAKSNIVTDSARRGAPKRLVDEIYDLVVHPTEQGARFVELLAGSRRQHLFPRKDGGVNEIDTTGVKRFIQINLLLDAFLPSILCWKQLRQAGIVEESLPVPVSMGIAELEACMDVIATQAERLHYLRRRQEIEANMLYDGDEMDLLGLYLDSGFVIPDLEFSGGRVMLTTHSLEQVDGYLLARERRKDVRRPARSMSPFWLRVLRAAEHQEGFWSDMVFVLLNVPFPAQVRFEREVQRLKRRWHKIQSTQNRPIIFASGPVERRELVVAVVGLRDWQAHSRHTVEEALSHYSACRAVVLAFDSNTRWHRLGGAAYYEPFSPGG